jgi:uncharacterized glyoxalase superfamily protein PhnB
MDLTSIIIAILGIISTIVTHLLSKKKYKQELASLNISNMQNALDFYKDLTDTTREHLKLLTEGQDNVLKENFQMKESVLEMNLKMDHMQALLCTNLPCTARIQDKTALQCIYLKSLENEQK